MELAPLALVPWAVDLVDGQIRIGDSDIHPVMARELWLRLGTLLDAQERTEDSAAWERLAAYLDRVFQHGLPCRGRSGRVVQPGVVVRESEERAIVRLAVFSVAILRRCGAAWDGPVMAARPAAHGWEPRPLGMSYRLAPAQVPDIRSAPLISTTVPMLSTEAGMPTNLLPPRNVPVAPRPPVQSDVVRAARERGAAAAGPILAALHLPRTFMELRELLPEMPEEELRNRLTWLAGLQRVRRRGSAWTLVRIVKGDSDPEVTEKTPSRARERVGKPTGAADVQSPPAPPSPAPNTLVPLVHPKTYEHRAAIQAAGGRWDASRRQWMVPRDQHTHLLEVVSGRGPKPQGGKPSKASSPPQVPLLPFRVCLNTGCQTACRTAAPACPRCKTPYTSP